MDRDTQEVERREFQSEGFLRQYGKGESFGDISSGGSSAGCFLCISELAGFQTQYLAPKSSLVKLNNWDFVKKKKIPDTSELVHMWIHRDCDNREDLYNFKPGKFSGQRSVGGHKVLPLTKKLLQWYLLREGHQFSPTEWLWVYSTTLQGRHHVQK